MNARLVWRRGALIALGQLGIGLTAAACAPNVSNNGQATAGATSAQAGQQGAAGVAATLSSAQSAASPAVSPAVSPVAGGSPAAIPNPQASPVEGAAPLPVPAPTPGGAPPTVVGLATTPAPAANASGSFPVEGAASPIASPAVAAASPSAVAAAATVMMTPDHRFDPADVTINSGQTVQWQNASRSPQTVTANPALASDPTHVSLPSGAQPFDSGVVNPNAKFSFTFTTPGNYQYVSLPFEAQGMVGRVSVE